MPDARLLTALLSAVEADPGNAPLRLHVAGLLIEASRPREALDQSVAVLSLEPANREALAMAERAARSAGDVPRADGYRSLLTALSGSTSGEPGAGAPDSGRPPPPVPEAVSRPELLDELDRFIDDVLGNAKVDIEHPQITLADVGGLDEVKRRLHTSFLGPMRNPELRKMYNKSLQGGLLLYGPPGCGKTFLAKAVAGELKPRFFAVGLHDVLDMWLGNSEKNLHAVFETARRNAPCVLFLDEVDALGLKRTNLSYSAGRNVVVQLLTEMDATRSDNEGVFVLAATNQPWDLDSALRRPGRFDRMLLVLPPDQEARVAILATHLLNRPTEGIKPALYGERTEGYSGADLRLVCEAAAERALEASIESGTPRPIRPDDIESALQEVKPSTRPWFEIAKNYAMFANESGVYDDLLRYMRKHRLG